MRRAAPRHPTARPAPRPAPRLAGRPAALARIGGVGALAAVGAILAVGGSAAQEVGRQLTFGTSIGLTANDNQDLDLESEGTTLSGTARFDFAYLLATPVQRLTLAGDIGLREVDGPGDDDDSSSNGLADPSLRLAYDRAVRDARFGLDAFVQQSAVAFLEPFEEGIDDPLILDDIDDLDSDTGTRLRFGLGTELELRRTAPFGVTLSAGYSALRYSDVTDPDLTDEERLRAAAALRFDIDPATRATLTLGYSSFEDDGNDEGRRDTFRVEAGIARDRPGGAIGASLGAVSTEDGERFTFALNRGLALPVWDINTRLGVTQSTDGALSPSIGLSVARDLPDGALSANLTRSIRSGSDDEEQAVTALSVGYARQVTPLTSIGADLSYIRNEPTGEGPTESAGAAGLTLQHALTEDWNLNLGLQHRIKDDGDADRASGNRISLNLRRSFTVRP